ncbi:MAG: hypothetical protein EXR71_15560 [Myxococcales bacterium]|nr:hypothetical protein [Myxococcales bacterium]
MSDSASEARAPGSGKTGRLGLALGLGVGLVVMGLGLCLLIPIIGILAAIAIPNFVAMDLKAKRAEVPGNVDGIKTAQLAYDAAYDDFVQVGSEAQARSVIGKTPHSWEGGGDWDRIGWSPDGLVRGGYWVTVEDGDFTVHGICDVDGDGDYAEYIATKSQNATLVGDPSSY